jgi:glycosyltransferase involved in cell wall biosynthesis
VVVWIFVLIYQYKIIKDYCPFSIEMYQAMPKLSIITINYNDLEGLKRTVESVVNQTWKEFEYIVIDGGSADGSTTYIESQSSEIDYWVTEPDKGIYNTMNKGKHR